MGYTTTRTYVRSWWCDDTHLCHFLPVTRAEADALNRESGRVYTETLIWQYRIYRRKVYLLARNNRQRRDIEHKVTRAVVNHATAEGAGTVYVGDLRDVGNGKRLHRNGQQLLSGWSHGRQIRYLAYKLVEQAST